MNVVDSSGWLEFIANEDNAYFFSPAITDEENLVVPVLCLYEVFKRLHIQIGKDAAAQAIGFLYRGQLVEINDEIALEAALISVEHNLPMADSVILSTARSQNAVLWTQDSHFKDFPDVRYVEKSRQ